MFSSIEMTLQSLRIYHYPFLLVLLLIMTMALVVLPSDHRLFPGIQVTNAQTLNLPEPTQNSGLIRQSSGNMSSSPSSQSFSEYNNSKYGFKVQYPSNWQVISHANSSVSPSIISYPSDVIVRITSPSDMQQGMQGLVTVGVENISAAHSQQAIGNLTAYDYAAPVIRQLPLMLGSATERNQTNLVRNESLNIGSETNGKNSKNLSAWRIDYVSSDYNSNVFVINNTKVFDISFSTPKESASQSVPIFDKLLGSIEFMGITGKATTGNTFGNAEIKNSTAAAVENHSITTSGTIPSSQTFQQEARPQSDLLMQGQQQQQEPQPQALLVPPFSLDPSESQPQQPDQMLQQAQPVSQAPFSPIQDPSQQQAQSLVQPFPSSLPQPPYTTLPPSAPLYPLPPILPTGSGQANNYPSPMILSQYPYVYNLSSINIAGEVLNQAPVTARSVKIVATFYDPYGQVLGTDSTFAEPSDLAPGQRAPFSMIVQEGSVPINQMSNYALNVDWRP